MRSSTLATLTVICTLLFLVGCGATYTYDNVTYTTANEALGALNDHLEKTKAEIEPTPKKAGGALLFVSPSFDTCVALGIKRRGNPQKEVIDYLGNYLVRSYAAMGDFIKKREIFDTVKMEIEEYPVPFAKKNKNKYDAVIYLKLVSPDQAQWFLMAKPNYKKAAIHMDKSLPAGSERSISWLNNIEKILKESNYKP
jgi:hypothetical protein